MKRLSLSDFFSLLASNAVNMPGPIWNNFGYGQCAAKIGPDHVYIQFSSILPKKAWIVLCKTNPDPIWMSWSGFGQTYVVLKQASVLESSGPGSGRMQLACYQFPTFRLGVHSSTDILDRIVQNLNQSGTYLVLADCQVFAKQIWPRSEPVCKNHLACFWPTLLSQSRPDANQIQHVYWEDSSSFPLSVDPTFLTWCHSETLPAYLSPRMDLWRVVCALNVKWAVICPVMCMITCTCRLVIIRRVIFSFIVSLIAQSVLIQLLN